MNINAINTTLSDTTLSEIKAKINDAQNLMPFLVALSDKERQFAFKMSHKRFDFVSQIISVCQNEPVIIPNWVNFEDLKNDYVLSNQLLGVENMLESLLIEVRDTRMQLGCEALKSSLDVYDLAKKSKDRIPGIQAIFEALRAAYPGRGKSKKKIA
jgi:hypothetical protein